MLTKTLMAAAVVVPALALSGAAYADPVYQGGPKSSIAMRAAIPTFETNQPYAQYVPTTGAGTYQHIYQGGPNTVVVHKQRE